MYTPSPPRRPWRNGGYVCWAPDRMLPPEGKWEGMPRGKGNCAVTNRKARVKQRRLDKHLCDPTLWDHE